MRATLLGCTRLCLNATAGHRAASRDPHKGHQKGILPAPRIELERIRLGCVFSKAATLVGWPLLSMPLSKIGLFQAQTGRILHANTNRRCVEDRVFPNMTLLRHMLPVKILLTKVSSMVQCMCRTCSGRRAAGKDFNKRLTRRNTGSTESLPG